MLITVAAIFTVCLSEKLGKVMRCRQIQHNFKCIEYLCKQRKEYLISVMSYFWANFSRQNLETVDIPHTFLSLTVTKLSTLKNSPVFWSTLYNIPLRWPMSEDFAKPGLRRRRDALSAIPRSPNTTDNNNNNKRICIAPQGRNFRGAEAR